MSLAKRPYAAQQVPGPHTAVLISSINNTYTRSGSIYLSRTLSISPAVTTMRSLSVAPGIRARIELPRLPLYRHCPFRL